MKLHPHEPRKFWLPTKIDPYDKKNFHIRWVGCLKNVYWQTLTTSNSQGVKIVVGGMKSGGGGENVLSSVTPRLFRIWNQNMSKSIHFLKCVLSASVKSMKILMHKYKYKCSHTLSNKMSIKTLVFVTKLYFKTKFNWIILWS